jgi:hypothetical protein
LQVSLSPDRFPLHGAMSAASPGMPIPITGRGFPILAEVSFINHGGINSMGTLSLTFRGPFLFVVPKPNADGVPSPTVHIYAPPCAGHLGSVFFGHSARPIYGRLQQGDSHTYTVKGVEPASSGTISYQWDYETHQSSPIVSPDLMENPPQYASTFPSAHFHICVPRPKIFYALDIVTDTDVVTTATIPDPSQSPFLTAFRLYYDWDLTVPAIKLFAPVTVLAKNSYWDITPPAGGPPKQKSNWLSLGDSGDIEFKFESPGLDDPHHLEAGACFDQIAKLAGLPWWLSFNNSGSGGGGAAFHTGSDCHALPIVLGLKN